MPLMPIGNAPVFRQDNIDGLMPSKWAGRVAADGTKSPWKDVAAGSEYTAIVAGTATFYFKKTSTSLAADWVAVTVAPVEDPESLRTRKAEEEKRRKQEEEEKRRKQEEEEKRRKQEEEEKRRKQEEEEKEAKPAGKR